MCPLGPVSLIVKNSFLEALRGRTLTKKRGRLLIYVDLTLLLHVNDSEKGVLHIFLIKLSEMSFRSYCRGQMVRIQFSWVVDRVYSWEHARMHMIHLLGCR
jgi:hypothetical protein